MTARALVGAVSIALAAPSPATGQTAPPAAAAPAAVVPVASGSGALASGSAPAVPGRPALRPAGAPTVVPPLAPPVAPGDEPLPPPAWALVDPLVEALGIDRYRTPSRDRVASPYREGPYGPGRWSLVPPLRFEPLRAPVEAEAALRAAGEPVTERRSLGRFTRPGASPALIRWCRQRKATVVRYGAEQDTFVLADCEGEIRAEGLERLSVLARTITAERPAWPLPDEPAASERGEWVEGVRLLPPRLALAVQRLVETWPWRPIYLISGYRPGSHGYHSHGRALDLFVMGVANERVYKICRSLPDMGCGYYPNNHFVHMDVRAPGSGKAYWIDTSAPGEPSHYVDSWPGVEAGGAAVWMGGE